jgi:L-lactate utilization protein LutB
MKITTRSLYSSGGIGNYTANYNSPAKGNHSFNCTCSFCTDSTAVDSIAMNLEEAMVRIKELEKDNKSLKRNANYLSPQEDVDPDIAQLLENNKKWVEDQSEKDPRFFDRIGAPQTPKFL